MGADHARILACDVPRAQVQVVCDASTDRARKIAEAVGAADMSTDPLAVIARKDIDAVLIASPDETHGRFTIAAIQAGKHVLCEKPLAPSSAECIEVMNAEVKTGLQMVHVGFMRRFDPSYTEIKAALEDGTLGQAVMMHNFHRNVEAPPSFTGQMAITNSAPHEFDIARFVLGAEFSSVSAFQPKLEGAGSVGAPVFVVIETMTGPLVNVEINNNAAYGYDVRCELVGKLGSAFLGTPVHSRINSGLKSVERYAADWRPRFAEAYRLQDKDWINAIQSGKPSRIAANAWDGYCATLVAEAGVRALKEGRKTAVEMVSKPALYVRHKETAE
jgi:myo-inositol 2-dehydrogenase / D-chiro-inositol 1-dehydrogenase